jgi:hypothetical protein
VSAVMARLGQTALAQDTVAVAVQVGGQLRGRVEIPAHATELETLEAARMAVARYLEGKTVRRQVVVPARLADFRQLRAYGQLALVDIPERSPGWSLEGVEADHRAGQHRQRIEALGVPLVADPQPPEATQPGPGSLDGPAVATQPLG